MLFHHRFSAIEIRQLGFFSVVLELFDASFNLDGGVFMII